MQKKVRDGEGNLIDERRKNNNGYKYTWAAILLLVAAIGWLFLINSRADNKIEKIQTEYIIVSKEISEIRTDIGWIKKYLEEMRRR